jgi:hypothetical protein
MRVMSMTDENKCELNWKSHVRPVRYLRNAKVTDFETHDNITYRICSLFDAIDCSTPSPHDLLVGYQGKKCVITIGITSLTTASHHNDEIFY